MIGALSNLILLKMSVLTGGGRGLGDLERSLPTGTYGSRILFPTRPPIPRHRDWWLKRLTRHPSSLPRARCLLPLGNGLRFRAVAGALQAQAAADV